MAATDSENKPPSDNNPRRPNYRFDVSDIVTKHNKTKNFGLVSSIPPRNPLEPVYHLPSEPTMEYPVPKFLRNNLSNHDIEGSRPRLRTNHLPTNNRQFNVSDIAGTSSRPRCYNRERGVIPDSLHTQDICRTDFKSRRTTDPLNPRYVFASTPAQALQCFNRQLNQKTGEDRPMAWQTEPQYGDIPGSFPRQAYHARQEQNQFALRTKDVPGATVGWERLNHPYPRSTWHKLPKDTAEVAGAQPRKGPRMQTNRHLHPCNPQYDLVTWVGHGTEMKNPFESDPKMAKFLARFNAEAAPAQKTEKKVAFNDQPSTKQISPPSTTSTPQSTATISTKNVPIESQLSATNASRVPRAATVPSQTFTQPVSFEAEPQCAADAANQRAIELRKKAIELHKTPHVSRMMSQQKAPQYRYPDTSFCEDPTSRPQIVDILPTSQDKPRIGASQSGFDYDPTRYISDGKGVLQQFTQTPTGRVVPKAQYAKTLTATGARSLGQPSAVRTSGGISIESKPMGYWTNKGTGANGPSSSLQYNGLAFKNYHERQNFSRRERDIAEVRTLPMKLMG